MADLVNTAMGVRSVKAWFDLQKRMDVSCLSLHSMKSIAQCNHEKPGLESLFYMNEVEILFAFRSM